MLPRTIGGAIGGQVAASLLAASLLADGYPSEHGYTVTFIVMAGVLGASVVAALAVPGRRRMNRVSELLPVTPAAE
jgi:hypothetical protein